jgi:hypothetical protein
MPTDRFDLAARPLPDLGRDEFHPREIFQGDEEAMQLVPSADHVNNHPLASAIEDAQHPFAAEAHGLTDLLDRVVAADERDFRGDIAPGGSL